MADKDIDPDDLREQLWKELNHERIVMLGLTGGDHMQPMAAFGDKQGDAIWFYTTRDTDLVRETGAGHGAQVCVMAKDMKFQASLKGRLVEDRDRAVIDRYWSPFVSAWFPKGKEDPNLTMMRLDPSDARAWVSSTLVPYPLKIAAANITHTLPDVGGKADVAM